MTTVASAIPTVLAALVSKVTETLGDAGLVVDGPDPADHSDLPLVVYIGASDPWGDEDGATESVNATQVWAWLGHTERRQELEVNCVIVAWNGSSDMAAARSSAEVGLGAFSDTIVADPTLGNETLEVTGLKDLRLDQVQGPDSARAELRFSVGLNVWLA